MFFQRDPTPPPSLHIERDRTQRLNSGVCVYRHLTHPTARSLATPTTRLHVPTPAASHNGQPLSSSVASVGQFRTPAIAQKLRGTRSVAIRMRLDEAPVLVATRRLRSSTDHLPTSPVPRTHIENTRDVMSMYPLAELYGGAPEGGSSRHPHILPGVSFARWRRDERAPRCDVCTRKFSFLRRRHHCRACGEVCCRNCVDFRLVDVPGVGPDIAYACRRCIERHDRKPSLVEDLASLARSFDQQQQARANVRPGRSNTTFSSSHGPRSMVPATRHGSASVASSPTHHFVPVSPAGVATLSPMASAVAPVISPRRYTTDFKVIVSQARHARLQITCLMIRDYLECKGGAVVLLEDSHVWVVAHKGLRNSTLHSDTFLSICHQAVKSKESFTASRPLDRSKSMESNASAAAHSRDHCRFFGAAPIFHHDKQFSTIGCLVALDTKPRDDIAARRTLASLERLARVVGDALSVEQNLLRIFTSGDFKIFAADALGSASLSSTPSTAAMSCIGTLSPRYGTTDSPAHASTDLRRSRSFIFANETSFFQRYADAGAEASASLPPKNPSATPASTPPSSSLEPSQHMPQRSAVTSTA